VKLRRLAFALTGAVFVATGCRPNPELAELPAPEAAPAGEASLEALAGRIDPGPQAMLTEGLPPWMFAMLGLEAKPSAPADVLLVMSRAEQAKFDASLAMGIEDNLAMVGAIRSLARAVALAEQAAAAGARDAETLARLERVYAAVDVPLLAGDRNTFSQFLSLFAQVAAADGVGPSDGAQMQQLAGVVQSAVKAAGPLHRHTVAELVRVDPEHEAVATGLLAAAKARRGTDDDWTVEAATAAVELRGVEADDTAQLDLARVCFAALDVACGDQALAAGSKHRDAASVRDSGELARRIVELQAVSSFDQKLERAEAQLELGRHGAAQAEFEALRAEAPKDARPVGGLAKLAIETRFDFIGAAELIDAAGPLENADEAFYALAIGTRATAAMATTIPHAISGDRASTGRALRPLMARMRTDVDGYAKLGNSDGRFLAVLLDVGEVLLDQYVKTGAPSLRDVPDLTARIVALQAQVPDNAHAYRLLMSASLFEPDKAQAIAAASVKPPPGPDHAMLAIRHARALCDLAVTWGDAALAKQSREAALELEPSAEAALLAADTLLVAEMLHDSGAWKVVAANHERLFEGGIEPEDARALNNTALALWRMGDREMATKAWTLSSDLATDYVDVARLNLLLATTAEGSPEAVAGMQSLARDSKTAGVRIVALAWLEAWAKGKKAKREAAAALAAAVEAELADATRPTAPDPYSGVLLQGSLQASFGYTVKQGLEINLDGSGLPWAIRTPKRP